MNQFNLFLELTRLKRPIGYMLLFWPCAWGLTIAYDFSSTFDVSGTTVKGVTEIINYVIVKE